MIVGGCGYRLSGTFQIQQLFCGRRNHRPWRLGSIEEITLQHGCGFRQSVAHSSCVLQAFKGDCPAVLPMKRETTESQHGCENTNQTAISRTMKASKQGRAACNTLSGQGTLDELEGTSG